TDERTSHALGPADARSMLLKYGSYAHAANECEVIRSKTRILNAAEQVLKLTARWQINGQLQGADAAAITTAKNALEVAYAKQYQDLILYQNDGSTIHDAIFNRGSTTGVVIVQGPDFPIGRGAEGGTFLSYSIVAEASYEVSASPAQNGTGQGIN